MAQYISVLLDGEQEHFNNLGLYEVIEYIGRREYANKPNLTSKEAYKLGRKVINSRLHKHHLVAIDRLVKAGSLKYTFDYDSKTTKAEWKMHKLKAKGIFRVIYYILRRYDSCDIFSLYETICKKYGFSNAVDATGSPYYTKIRCADRLIAEEYTEEEILSLTSCVKKIKMFSVFY